MAISFDLAVIPMKKRQERWPEIPYDVVIEILTRVPPKSLMRFKSVSKQWSSLICSQYFTKRFQRVSSSAPRLYMRLIFDDLKTILQSASPSSDSDITFEADQDLTRPAMSGYSPSKLFHGLMCFNKWPSALIYNTTTRQLVVLPDIEESNMIDSDHKSKKIMYSIGHDPVDDQYKVVCIVGRLSDQVEEYTYLSEHWVLLLGGGGGEDGSSRWRKISCGCTPHLPLGQGVINTNGRMHYLALVGMKAFCVSFDINSGEISMRQVPEDVFWLQIYCIYLIEYNGKIAILDYCNLRDQGVMKLWVVEDEEKNMWSSKTLVLHPCQMHMVNSIRLRVQGTTPNGDVIFAPNREDTCTFTICLYDLHKNHMRKVDIKGATPNSHLTKCCDIIGMDDVDNLIYL